MNKQRGITLIALVITIIVLLILAGISLTTLTGENGVITKAKEAKIETALGGIKDVLKIENLSQIIGESRLTPEELLAKGQVRRTVKEKDGKFYMYYALKEDSFKEMQGYGKGNVSELKDVFLIDDTVNVKQIYPYD